MSFTESEASLSSHESLYDPFDESHLENEIEDLTLDERQAARNDNVEGAQWSGMPHEDDPVADEGYMINYRRQVAERDERMKILTDRFEGRIDIADWCKCGHCSLAFIQKKEELSCCTEMNNCVEACTSELVMAELGEGRTVVCITDHPGFEEVVLGRWTLRVAGGKYKTRNHEKYHQRESEDKFLRSVAYRQFTRFVHGQIGNRRIPLPACAYASIRRKFDNKNGEEFTGYRDQEETD